MYLIETTAACRRTPLLHLALREVGADYEERITGDGELLERYLTMGPILHDGDIVIPELFTALRHVARRAGAYPSSLAYQARFDSTLELYACWLLPALVRLARAARTGIPDDDARALLDRCAARVAQLVGEGFVLPKPSVADCPAVLFVGLQHLVPSFQPPLALAAYLERVTARPAFTSALAA